MFDPAMLTHACTCPQGNNPLVHPESPFRITAVLKCIAASKMQIPRGLLSASAAAAAGDQQEDDDTSSLCLRERLPLVFYCHLMRGRMATKVSFHCLSDDVYFGTKLATTAEPLIP